jgi:CheY-like chemotaxis protein
MGEVKKVKRRRPLILDVHDDESWHVLVRGLLGRMGYEVVTADDGRQGVETALRESPDLILMNYMMPVMDGDEATRRLREYPHMRDVPIICNTACADQQTLDGLMAAGATAYFILPTDPHEIIEILERYCPVPKK